MDFMFEWQELYLTSERSERVRYSSCHENISSSQRVMFFLLYRRADDAIFDESPKISDHFPKISKNCSEGQKNVSGHFLTISEDFPKITKDCRGRPKKIRICFDHTPRNSANSTKAKGENRDVIERYDTRKGVIRKIRYSDPG